MTRKILRIIGIMLSAIAFAGIGSMPDIRAPLSRPADWETPFRLEIILSPFRTGGGRTGRFSMRSARDSAFCWMKRERNIR